MAVQSLSMAGLLNVLCFQKEDESAGQHVGPLLSKGQDSLIVGNEIRFFNTEGHLVTSSGPLCSWIMITTAQLP